MICLSCNRILSDREATRKYESTGEFLDLCDRCMKDVPVVYVEDSSLSDINFNDTEEGIP